MIALVTRERGSSQRPHGSIDRLSLVTELLQFRLNTGDDLVGGQAVGAVDRLIVLIIRVWIVAPGGIPPAVIPAPPARIEKNDGSAVVPPPIVMVVMMLIHRVDLLRLRRGRPISVPIAQSRRRLRIQLCLCRAGDDRLRSAFAIAFGSGSATGVQICAGRMMNGRIAHSGINQGVLPGCGYGG